MKKIFFYILILIVVTGFLIPHGITSAQTENSSSGYTLLEPLPCDSKTPGCSADGKLTTFDPNQGLGAYLNLMIKIIIGLAAVLSVIMIVVGGIEYMTSELSHTKEAGKERILHAIFGLLIALGAYALLFTINPDLLKSDLSVPDAKPTAPAVTPAVTPSTP